MANLEEIRHSLAHIMAYAVQDLFGSVKMGVGPTTEAGFYYDLDLEHRLSKEDLKNIQKKMQQLIKQDLKFIKDELPGELAQELFKNDPYKQELIREIIARGENISLYRCGDFVDLCRGPHVKSSKEINAKAFKLSSIAGSYWRGDENNPMLQRIYGIAFAEVADLKEHMALLEQMEQRDHRKLARDLELFSWHEEAGSGFVYWHPMGARIRIAVEDFWRQEHYKNAYEMLFTPHIGKGELWEKSGHLDFYKDSMFAPMDIDGNDYYIKPMNCPFHIMIYKSRQYSYRDLPCRWAELGTVYRYERSGTLHGSTRVRGFTQDDAHIICRPDQVESEILRVLKFSLNILKAFGFTDIEAFLSTKPEKSVGAMANWELAQNSLLKALNEEEVDFQVDEGGGAFYGPKIDLKIKDAMRRSWQLSTIQFDFNLPQRFDMSYVDKGGQQVRPLMIHRALLGSLERFFGILIEHFAGQFPLWLAPVQIAVISIRPEHNTGAELLVENLKEHGFRVEFYDRNENLNQKIKRAQKQKTPYMLILGDEELSSNTLAIRMRGNKVINKVPVANFINACLAMLSKKDLDLVDNF